MAEVASRAATTSRRVMTFSSRRADAYGFDDAAQIPRRIPSGLHRLGVAGIIGGAHFQVVGGCSDFYRQLLCAERIFAEILAEVGRRPGLAAVDRNRDVLDALAAVEGDAL